LTIPPPVHPDSWRTLKGIFEASKLIVGSPEDINALAQVRGRMLTSVLTALTRHPEGVVALLWLADGEPGKSRLTIWAAAGTTPDAVELAKLAGVSVASARLQPGGPAGKRSAQLRAADLNISALKEPLRSRLGSALPSSAPYPLEQEIVLPVHASSSEVPLGVIHIIGPASALADIDEETYNFGVQLAHVVGDRIELGRQQRVAAAVRELQDRILKCDDPRDAIQITAEILGTYSTCFDCSVYAHKTVDSVVCIASSRHKADIGREFARNTLPGMIHLTAVPALQPQSLRLGNIFDRAELGQHFVTAPNLDYERQLCGAEQASVIVATLCLPTSAGRKTAAAYATFRLLNYPRRKFPGGRFSYTDQAIADRLVQYLADFLPGRILSHELGAISARILGRQQTTPLVDLSYDDRELEFARIAEKHVAGVRRSYIVRERLHHGQTERSTRGSTGAFVDLPVDIRWSGNRRVGALTWRGNDGGVYTHTTIYNSHKEKLGLLCELRRPDLVEVERNILDTIASEYAVATLGDADVPEKMTQTAEIRHHLRNELLGVIGHIENAVTKFEQAAQIRKDNDDARAARIIFQEAGFRKSLLRTAYSAREVERLFEDTRVLLGDMTRANLQLGTHDLAVLIKDQVRNLRAESQRRKVQVNVIDNYDRSLGLPMVDRRWMSICIANILDNAVKYSFAEHDVFVTLSVQKNLWLISTTNEGRQIPESSYEQIFQPFKRLHDPAGRQLMPGTGLGLAAVRTIIGLHDDTEGVCTVKSVPLSGSDGGTAKARTTFVIGARRRLTHAGG